MTWLPADGDVVGQGQPLYRVNGDPVVLLNGSIPSHRDLSVGDKGNDVRELNADLVKLGYASRADLSPTSKTFTDATATALKKLQKHLHLDQNGRLDLGQAVFLPTAARVTSEQATLGAPISAGAPVLQATSPKRQVSVDLDTSQQSEVKPGDKVNITLPNNKTTPGIVTDIGKVASSPSSGDSGSGSDSTSGNSSDSSSSGDATVEVDIKLTDPSSARTWDQAPVTVTITTDTVKNALVVPVNALLAQPGGRYAVDVVAADGTHKLVPVGLGMFDDADGLVQVTGTGLVAGDRVVVPKI